MSTTRQTPEDFGWAAEDLRSAYAVDGSGPWLAVGSVAVVAHVVPPHSAVEASSVHGSEPDGG